MNKQKNTGAVSFLVRPSNFHLVCSIKRERAAVAGACVSPFITLTFIQLGLSALITVVTVAATVVKQFTGREQQRLAGEVGKQLKEKVWSKGNLERDYIKKNSPT